MNLRYLKNDHDLAVQDSVKRIGVKGLSLWGEVEMEMRGAVVPFDDDTPEALIRAAKPDILVKGGDYHMETVVGADIVKAWGGEVRLAAFLEGHSTTATLRRAAGRS